MTTSLEKRRQYTDERLKKLVAVLREKEADQIAEGCACVYATGSGGRGEMSQRSDLDIFIVTFKDEAKPLTNLNEIRLKARLIEASRKLEFDDFSDDGKYVKAYDAKTDLIDKLGTVDEDHENVLTARLLLLLESRPLLNGALYDIVIDAIVANYWRDFERNSVNFRPVFLLNDIIRFWKTLCLNYEQRTGTTRKALGHHGQEDDRARGKRRLHNYKLKHSRMLTCYSAILYMMAVLKRDGGTVKPEAVLEMVKRTPTERMESLILLAPETRDGVAGILRKYGEFLDVCDEGKASLLQKFNEPEFKKQRFADAEAFGLEISNLLHEIGKDSELLRYLVV